MLLFLNDSVTWFTVTGGTAHLTHLYGQQYITAISVQPLLGHIQTMGKTHFVPQR